MRWEENKEDPSMQGRSVHAGMMLVEIVRKQGFNGIDHGFEASRPRALFRTKSKGLPSLPPIVPATWPDGDFLLHLGTTSIAVVARSNALVTSNI